MLRLIAGWGVSVGIPVGIGICAGDLEGVVAGIAATLASAIAVVLLGRWLERRPRAQDIVLSIPLTATPSIRIAGTGRQVVDVSGPSVQAAAGVTAAAGGTLPSHIVLEVRAGHRILATDRGRSGALVHANLPNGAGQVIVSADGVDLSWVVVLRGVEVAMSAQQTATTSVPMRVR